MFETEKQLENQESESNLVNNKNHFTMKFSSRILREIFYSLVER